jgi:hypothetical protein
MSRIDNIEKFAQKRESEQTAKEIAKIQQIEEYKEKIKSLKSRIDELLAVGNACLKHRIPLEGREWGGREGYDTHQFVTNGWSHLVGFVMEYEKETKRPLFKRVGKEGGGACNFDLKTDGVTIEVSGDVLGVLRSFVEGFDKFETEFYQYVDGLTT